MFVQVIQGKVTDVGELRAAIDRWLAELAPGANGWLGTTSGVTEDGTFAALVCFESQETAQANSHRPEQHQWWMETSKLFSGEVVFHDCAQAELTTTGDPGAAGFVQIIQGRVRDAARMRELMRDGEQAFAGFRPEILGELTALHGDGGYTTAVYFTSEEAAREGERKEPPAGLKRLMAEMDALTEGPDTFFDLHDPWLAFPR